MKILSLALFLGVAIVGCDQQNADSHSAPRTDTTATPTTNPDNTAINSRDRASGAVTAGMQGQGKSDIDITAEIRRRVMAGDMSVSAQNTKIVCQGGKVTLRGPVNTQAERDAIGQIANEVAGASSVDNQLEVKP